LTPEPAEPALQAWGSCLMTPLQMQAYLNITKGLNLKLTTLHW